MLKLLTCLSPQLPLLGKPAPGLVSLTCFLLWGTTLPARAKPPETAPPAVTQSLTQINAAANRQDLDGVMAFYDPEFAHRDGLNVETLATTLTQLWSRYPTLAYDTTLLNWDREVGESWVTETQTKITGVQSLGGRDFTLVANLRSRQRWENGLMVYQETLSEQNQLTTGEAPPAVTFKLPEQVKTGGDYSLDAIVEEPLGQDILLGSLEREPVQASQFLAAVPVKLEPLRAGGIFRLGRASDLQEQDWISTVFIRQGGVRITTQRLQTVERDAPPRTQKKRGLLPRNRR